MKLCCEAGNLHGLLPDEPQDDDVVIERSRRNTPDNQDLPIGLNRHPAKTFDSIGGSVEKQFPGYPEIQHPIDPRGCI